MEHQPAHRSESEKGVTPPPPIAPLHVTAYTAVSAAGDGKPALLDSLRSKRTGLAPNDDALMPLPTWVGRVPGLDATPLPPQFAQWECANNRLAWRGLLADDFIHLARRAVARHGAHRVAVIVGTSTSSIGATEEAYRRLEPDGYYPADLRRPIVHTPHSLGHFVQQAVGARGIALTVLTACSSSAKVFAQASRWIAAGLVDAAVVGGVDSLCGSVLYGFNSLALVSAEPCRPFDRERRGLSLGEAAGFALLEREGSGPRLLGYGETSDAHHMSAPDPRGEGARRAIVGALARAGLPASAIGYINLHGTASVHNDAIEAAVVAALFSPEVHASSTKGWTGHALGAAGILEAVITLLAIESGFLPGTLNARVLDAACGPQIRTDHSERRVDHALTNSFGFGGSNCALVFGGGPAR